MASLTARSPVPADVLVEIRNVCKSYRLGEASVMALKDVDLQIVRSEFIAVVGASGAGKTTLMNIVGLIDKPTSGAIIFEGNDAASLSEAERALVRNKYVGFVFQVFNLIPVLNVFENVELPLLVRSNLSKAERREKALAALADVGLSDQLGRMPDKLSGGQRQRVAIARALVTDPGLVIADEPTANLDSVTGQRIIELMEQLNSQRRTTFLISTHDEKLIARAQRVIRIKDGVVQL